jgi:hypothetical protein
MNANLWEQVQQIAASVHCVKSILVEIDYQAQTASVDIQLLTPPPEVVQLATPRWYTPDEDEEKGDENPRPQSHLPE